MSKPFNIHDWQAKQRLVEQEETINEAHNPELSRMVNRFIKGIAQKYSY